jgi:tellurium resistance protein TerZ
LGGQKVDLDGSVVIVNEMGHTIDAVFYNKLTSDCNAIVHSGDQRDGTKEGYDEVITIDL